MTTHNRPGYHQADWVAADKLGARIRLIEFALIPLCAVTAVMDVRAFM